jgi:hypothetical protein
MTTITFGRVLVLQALSLPQNAANDPNQKQTHVVRSFCFA